MNIALVANDKKKSLMENICIAYRNILVKHDIYATGTTGSLIEETSNLHVHKYLAGELGGEQQLATQISNNEIDLVIYLKDSNNTSMHGGHRLDVNTVISLCNMHNIPLATNSSTAEALLFALDRGDLDWRNIVRANK